MLRLGAVPMTLLTWGASLTLLAGQAVAQDASTPPSNSLTPLLIITVTVLVLVVGMLWFMRTPKTEAPATVKAPSDAEAAKGGDAAQAAAAFAAFEKAKLMGKKVQQAAAEKDAKAGEPLSDEHPS